MEIKWNLPHLLTNFEIKKYHQNEPTFSGFYSRDNLLETIKNGAYVTNLDKYADVSTHWISLCFKQSEIIYYGSFRVEHIPKEIEKFIGQKNINTNLFKMQSNNSTMCGYFSIGFIDFMFADTKIDWFYKFVFSLWFWKKWQYNFELFQR